MLAHIVEESRTCCGVCNEGSPAPDSVPGPDPAWQEETQDLAKLDPIMCGCLNGATDGESDAILLKISTCLLEGCGIVLNFICSLPQVRAHARTRQALHKQMLPRAYLKRWPSNSPGTEHGLAADRLSLKLLGFNVLLMVSGE